MVDRSLEDARTRFEGVLRFGTSSWSDRSLLRDGSFYPKSSMTAAARLAYYSARFSVAEVSSTFRFPPTPELSAQWAERTPPGFRFDIRAWSLLSGAPTLPDSLWPDLAASVRERSRDCRRLYPSHLPPEALEECWARFSHALRPLREAGRLGVVVLRYPAWFTPRPGAWAELAAAPGRLRGLPAAVELHSPRWLEGDACEATLEWLEDHGLGFVCVDGPAAGPRALPRVVAATADVAVLRFSGRRAVEGEPWTSPYRYSAAELNEWVPRLAALEASATEVHVLFDNCWRSDAVDNAAELAGLCTRGHTAAVVADPPGATAHRCDGTSS